MAIQRDLRNIGIVAHVDAGKTTITENMLYVSGGIRSLGSVDQGTAHTDFMDVERDRGISVRAASVTFTWDQTRINLLDTPGHVDFSAEVERSLRILDGAVLVISAAEGVQAQTEVLWHALQALKIPTLIFINKIDRMGADIQEVLADIHKSLTETAMPFQRATGVGTAYPALQTLLLDAKAPLEAEDLWERLIECAADMDEAVMEQYLLNQPISPQLLIKTLTNQVHRLVCVPVFYGCAMKGLGIKELLSACVTFLPPPKGDTTGPVSGVVFKLERDKVMGKIAHVRLYSGMVKNRDSIYNHTRQVDDKITQIRNLDIRRHQDAGVLAAGDIGGFCGLGSVRIGDILGDPTYIPREYQLAQPHLKIQASPADTDSLTAVVSALQELSEEDPLLNLEWLKDERELHIHIMGTIQIEVLSSVLKSRFNLDVVFGKPSILYKETPAGTGEGFEAYTMPKPCWAVVKFLIEPGERGSGVVYRSTVGPNRILPRYQNHIAQCLPHALKQGLYGWEVTDLLITLIDGEHHLMHTHPMDFFVATPMAIMNGFVNTGTILLEPMLHFRISAPEESAGRILGDLVQMRGSFDGPVIQNGTITIDGSVPVATSLEYPVRLGSVTAGRGIMTTRFDGYQECSLEQGTVAPRRGINPLDRSKYILYARSALSGE